MRQRFKVEYTDCGQRLVYLRLYSGTLCLRDTVALAGKKAENHRDAYSIQREIVRTDTAHKGEIVIFQRQRGIKRCIGDQTRLPRERVA